MYQLGSMGCARRLREGEQNGALRLFSAASDFFAKSRRRGPKQEPWREEVWFKFSWSKPGAGICYWYTNSCDMSHIFLEHHAEDLGWARYKDAGSNEFWWCHEESRTWFREVPGVI